MNKPNLRLIPQQQAEVIRLASAKLEPTENVIVKHSQLMDALQNARRVSDALDNIENLDDLDLQEMAELCRTACQTVQLLTAMLDQEVTAR